MPKKKTPKQKVAEDGLFCSICKTKVDDAPKHSAKHKEEWIKKHTKKDGKPDKMMFPLPSILFHIKKDGQVVGHKRM